MSPEHQMYPETEVRGEGIRQVEFRFMCWFMAAPGLLRDLTLIASAVLHSAHIYPGLRAGQALVEFL